MPPSQSFRLELFQPYYVVPPSGLQVSFTALDMADQGPQVDLVLTLVPAPAPPYETFSARRALGSELRPPAQAAGSAETAAHWRLTGDLPLTPVP